jgi:hypothetical protein
LSPGFFLLTAVSSMIGAVAGRLAHHRPGPVFLRPGLKAVLSNQCAPPGCCMTNSAPTQAPETVGQHLALRRFCAILIGTTTIVLLFLGETSANFKIATVCFLAGVMCNRAGLLSGGNTAGLYLLKFAELPAPVKLMTGS